jgi:hypothetical protein
MKEDNPSTEKMKVQQASLKREIAEYQACKGIPTKALEEGIIQEMIELCRSLDNGWSASTTVKAREILSKLKEN